MNKFFLLFLVCAVFGCAFANNMNRITLGMSKEDVIKQLGSPTSTSAQNGVEYLKYDFYNSVYMPETHFVRIVGGKVESYGKMGDFDSSKTPEQKIIVDLNQKP